MPLLTLFFLFLSFLPFPALAQDLTLKIPITQEGIYRIRYEDLGFQGQPYGIDPGKINPAQFHLYNRSREAAIHVAGAEDGRFGPGDSIEFYATPMGPNDPEYKYTEENVYWLTVNPDPPLRMASWESDGSGTPEASFLHTFHAERNWLYWETMPDGVGLDHWFWGQRISAGSKRDYTFPLSNIGGASQTPVVRVYLHGRTNDPVNPDHKTLITLNGTLLGEVIWDGQKPVTHSFENVPRSLLIAGTNTLTVEEVVNPGVTVDSIVVNWIEVDYYKTFAAEDNKLKFTARGNGTQAFSISNLTNPTVEILDISDPIHVRRLSNPSLRFSDTISGQATYLVMAPEISTSFTFQLAAPTLKNTDNGADYILITSEKFKDSVLPLAQHRESQGYSVKVVTTREIYDAFSGGIFTPQAIKDFFKYTYENWQNPTPEFVLLVGDANLDYKDYWATGQINEVPTYLVETTVVGETPSDHWFVTVSGDDPLPDMLIGRIPAKTVSEITVAVNKIIAYETGPTGDWQHRVLMASNDQDSRFESFTEEWITEHFPENYTPQRVHVSHYADKTQARTDFLKDLNDGVLIAGFLGHGSVDVWAGSQDLFLLKSEDASSLTNRGTPPFVVGFNCLNGLFALPSEGTRFFLPDGSGLLPSIPLPEALLFQEDHGALAMWAPAAFAYPSEQRWIGHELFSGLFDQGNNVLGSVTTQAKVNAYVKKGIYEENLDVFTFFGDPATRLALEKKNNSSTGAGSGGGGCFIATAAYGSYLHPYVYILRDFRDQVLLQTEWGNQMVEAYYSISPPLAGWIQDREWARHIVQLVLLPLILTAWLAVGAPGWVQVGLLVLLAFGGIALISRKWLRSGAAGFFLVLWFSGMSAVSPSWAITGDEDIQVIRSDERGLSVKLTLPLYGVQKKTSGRVETSDQITVQDYGFLRGIGKPELPMRGVLIAIPENGEVTFTVSPGEYETRRLRIGPASPQEKDPALSVWDPAVYEKDAFYPGPLVAKGFTGYMRDRRVMQILFYPVQYNPVKSEVRIYREIQLAIDFERPMQSLRKAVPGERSYPPSRPQGYEKFLQGVLLNYHD